jgi:subtilisin-like proprotein convertase family protein
MPEYFAVRLKQGKANDDVALEAACGKPKAETRHIDSADPEKMDVFAVREAGKLEETMDALRKAPASDVVTHMYAMDDTPDGGVIPTGAITLQFASDVGGQDREKILEEFGLEIVEDLDFLPNGYTVRLTEASTENPLKIAAKLQARKELKIADPELIFKISFKHIPADTLYHQQWHLKNLGNSPGLSAGADVKAEGAWEHTRGSRNIVVCVMDDGFDLEHPDFKASEKIVDPRDFGEGDFDPSPGLEDDNHGTACAGVAIAEENGTGVVGLAPLCAFMPVRTSRWISDESIKKLFQYAIDHTADVISCSWSAGAWNFPLSAKMHGIIKKAATQGRANGKGCVILFAAGNEDRPLDGEKDGRVSHQGFALHPNVIAVGASNSLDKRSFYSNYGPELTICAPSSGSPGRSIVTTDRRGAKGYSSEDYTSAFGGTSSATPLAAGLASLILTLNPDLNSTEVKRVMMDTADKIDSQNGNYVDGHSSLYGHGRINAKRALDLVAGTDGEQELPKVLFMEHRINKSIPDQGEIQDAIIFPLEVNAQDIEVHVEILHTWRGDLRVTVIPPQGGEITLVDGSGGSQDNLILSFRSSDDPALFRGILGTSAGGEWRLQVMDMAKQDVGTLVKWGLGVTYV